MTEEELSRARELCDKAKYPMTWSKIQESWVLLPKALTHIETLEQQLESAQLRVRQREDVKS